MIRRIYRQVIASGVTCASLFAWGKAARRSRGMPVWPPISLDDAVLVSWRGWARVPLLGRGWLIGWSSFGSPKFDWQAAGGDGLGLELEIAVVWMLSRALSLSPSLCRCLR